jgi:hypothetical protein
MSPLAARCPRDYGPYRSRIAAEAVLDVATSVVSLRRGEQIRFSDDPEEWARSLVLAYRSGDLIATSSLTMRR